MIVMRETIDIPVGREVHLKIPEMAPVGCRATITVSVSGPEVAIFADYDSPENKAMPAIEKFKQQAAEKTALRKANGKKPFEGLRGIFKDSAAFAGNPEEIVREWRDEWVVDR
jgi:hypothetical protein